MSQLEPHKEDLLFQLVLNRFLQCVLQNDHPNPQDVPFQELIDLWKLKAVAQ